MTRRWYSVTCYILWSMRFSVSYWIILVCLYILYCIIYVIYSCVGFKCEYNNKYILKLKRNVAYEIRHYFKIIEIFTFAYGMAVMYKGKAAHVWFHRPIFHCQGVYMTKFKTMECTGALNKTGVHVTGLTYSAIGYMYACMIC